MLAPNYLPQSNRTTRWRHHALSVVLLACMLLIFVPWEHEIDGAKSRVPQYLAAFLPFFLLLLFSPRSVLASLGTPPVVLLLLAPMLIHAGLIVPVETPRYFFGLLGLVMTMMAITCLSIYRHEQFSKVLRAFIWIVIFSFALQLAIFMATDELLDIHQWIFPASSSRGSALYLNVTRLTGLHIEPGTYSVSTVIAVMSLRILTRRFEFVSFVALASVIGTYSTEGLVSGGALATWMLFDRVERGQLKDIAVVVVAIASTALLIYFLGIAEYLETRFSGRDDGSAYIKQLPLIDYARLSISEKVIGIGFSNRVCYDCSMDNLGYGFNMLMKGGAFFILSSLIYSYVCLFHRNVHPVHLIAVFAVALVARFSLTVPLVWMMIALLPEHAMAKIPTRPVRAQ